MGCESSDVVRFDLEPLFQGQVRRAKFKSAYNLLIIGPRGFWMVKQHIGNHGLGIFWLDGFDLGPLLQGQTRIANLKSAYNLLVRGLQCESNL